jgi:peptidoglycan/xylan/chitin deacetylase (PgdA/CDA1 family)
MKRWFRLLISLPVWGGDLLQTAFVRLLGRQPRPICVVLYYHTVPAHHRDLFVRQMNLLLSLARPLPTEPGVTLEPGRHYVAVTFDDGFVSVLENAAPELERRQIPWTVFVPSGCLGQSPPWIRHAPAVARQDRVMSSEELRELTKNPLVTIGSHTVTHAHLVEVGPEQASVELARSKADLEAVLDRPVTQFSYPFGARTPALDQRARAVGYRRLFSSVPQPAFRRPDEWVIGRINVDPDISLLEFRLKVLGAYRWLAAIRGWESRRS